MGGGGGSSEIDALIDGTMSGNYRNDAVTVVREGAFLNMTALTSLHLANVTEIKGSCTGGSGIQTLVFPSLSSFNKQYCLQNTEQLKAVDFNGNGLTIDNYTFNKDSKLSTVVLRYGNAAVLQSVNALNGTPFASNGTGGTLYVPQALIADYQSATTWSTILGYANNQILPIEGSIYETQYADGTPIV